MEEGIITKGMILLVYSESGAKQWAIGSRITVNGFEETYEVALCNDEIPTDYSTVIKIVPHGVEPLPLDFKFYLDNTDPKNIGRWKNVGKLKNVGLPVLLATGTFKLNEMMYQFIIMKRHEKDVWTLYLENGKKLNEHTVYTIGLQMLSTLQYIHKRSWIHGDIKGSNIMVDPSENHINLMNYHFASRCTTSNNQIHSNKGQNIAIEYMSRDAHMGVPTVRGDIESLFYNLVQWLGAKLPWEKNLENLYLVKEQKNNAFANVEQFLHACFGNMKIPGPIRNFMNQVAIMKQQDKQRYPNLKWTLRNGLKRVPAENLQFRLDDVHDDVEGSSDAKQSKLRRGPRSELGVSVDLLAKIISKNCKCEKEVNLQGEVVSGSLIHAIYQITRIKWSQERQVRLAMAWEQDIEGLKTKTKKLWALKTEKRATSNTALTENEPEESSQTSPAATVTSGQVNDGLNHSDPGNSFSQSYFGAMSSNETPAQEDLASLDPPNFFPPNVRQNLLDAPSASSSRSNVVHSPFFRTSSSGYSSRSCSRVGFHPEDLPLFKTPDPFLEKEHYQSSKETAVESREASETVKSEEQQLRRIETLSGQLEGQRAVLASAGTVTEQLCQAFSDPTFKADLRSELRSVNDFYDDLQRRINVKKAEIERNLSDGRQFDDSCKKIIVWLAKELDMSEKLIVSADPMKLLQLREHYQNVMSKETDMNDLLRKGRDFLSRPQNLENVELQQSLLGLMESQWDRLKKNSLQISIRLEICTEHHDKYCQAQKLLLSWLSNVELKLRGLQPTMFDVVEKALTELSLLRMEIREKMEEFEQCAHLGDTFINACDEDKNLVKSELIAMKDRWEKLINDLRERTQFLKDTADRFNVFTSCLKDLERRMDELKSRHASLEESGDSNLIDCIKELQKDAESLRGSPLEDVRRLADELKSKVGDQEIDISGLLNAVDIVGADIKSFWTKLAVSLNKAYEQKYERRASAGHDIKPTINTAPEEDVKPPILLSTTIQLSDEIVDLVSDSESEAELVIDEKPLIDPMPEELIDLVSTSESEADLVAQQQKELEPHILTHQNQLEEVLENDEYYLESDKLEQKN